MQTGLCGVVRRRWGEGGGGEVGGWWGGKEGETTRVETVNGLQKSTCHVLVTNNQTNSQENLAKSNLSPLPLPTAPPSSSSPYSPSASPSSPSASPILAAGIGPAHAGAPVAGHHPTTTTYHPLGYNAGSLAPPLLTHTPPSPHQRNSSEASVSTSNGVSCPPHVSASPEPAGPATYDRAAVGFAMYDPLRHRACRTQARHMRTAARGYPSTRP